MKTTNNTPQQIIEFNKHIGYDLIRAKIPSYAEIIVNFFDHCNMRCVFCPQDHEDRTGVSREEILSKVDPICEFIQLNQSEEFHLHLMGGELFQDEFIEQGYLEHYADFIQDVELRVSDIDSTKKLDFNFITNLVVEDIQSVAAFCHFHKLKIAVSYDSFGRFTKKDLELFTRNIEIIAPYIRMISLTMTKQSMELIVNGEDTYFDYLYSRFDCDWDHLLPGNDGLKPMMPAESDLLRFYKVLADKYPKCINMKSFTENKLDAAMTSMPCTRGNSFTIFSDNSVPKGCSGSVILKNANTADLGGPKIIENFVDSRNCFECEYYSRCTFSCFIHNEYKDLVRDVDGCVYAKVFDYVKETENE